MNYPQIDQLGPITDRRAKENSEISSPLCFLGQQQGTATAHTVDYRAKMLLWPQSIYLVTWSVERDT